MKRTTTATGLLTLAILVFGAFSVGSASAQQFAWTGPLPAVVLVLSDNPQIFNATESLGFRCEHFGARGVGSNGKAMTSKEITLTGTYSKCESAGLAVKVTEVEYLLNANNSVGVIGKPIVITIPALGCSLKINNGAPNNNLTAIRFLNQASDILAHVEVTHITSLASGEPCGPAGVEKTEGTYRGLLLAFVHGGSLRWEA